MSYFSVSKDQHNLYDGDKKLVCANMVQALTSEFPSTQSDATNIRNRNFPPSTNTYEVAVDEGDRILITTGVMKFSGSSSRTYNMRAGNDQAEDAPEDQTDANYDTRNPWFEFSQDIVFPSTPSSGTALVGYTAGPQFNAMGLY